MRDCGHSQIFTVFGGSYVTENHGFSILPAKLESKPSSAKWVAVAGLLMLGITTATAMKTTGSLDGLWSHRSAASWTVAGFEDAVY